MEKITDIELKEMLTKIDTEEKVEIEEPIINEIPKEDKSLEDLEGVDLNFNVIPDTIKGDFEERALNPILESRTDINLGVSVEDLKDLCAYMAGKGEKPLFVDQLMADTEGRLKEMTSVMTLIQLSQIPVLTALRNQVLERLFDPKNLYDMDSKTLSATLTSLNKDIMNILDISIKNVQTTAQFGSLNNEYRKLLDGMMMLPPEKLAIIKETVLENETNLNKSV